MKSSLKPKLTGRYAPSPTGNLHLGNLRTALASYLSIRSRGGTYLLRIEDLDQSRSRTEHEQQQLRDLQSLGIVWDEDPWRQSARDKIYSDYFVRLQERQLVYPCFASRKEIREALSAPHREDNDGQTYPGIYADYPMKEAQARIESGEQHSWRIRVSQAPKEFFDGFAGRVEMDLEQVGGDFIIKRADGFHSYQLACAIDDACSGVTEVLRGDDLLDSGARQAYILFCLGLDIPRYVHIPLMIGEDKRRLAKRLGSDDLSGFLEKGYKVEGVLSYLAYTLGQCPLGERVTMSELIENWDQHLVQREPFEFREAEMQSYLR